MPGPLRPTDLPTDVRLVAADMDGTLLDERGKIPEAFWPLLRRLHGRGIVFAPASGRQYPALAAMFARADAGLALIAENGAYVVRDGAEISSSTVEAEAAEQVVRQVRRLAAEHDLGLVWSGRRSAYVERAEEAFVAEAGRFYTSLQVVDDLLAAPEPPLKFAVFDFAGAANSREVLAAALHPFQVVMSGVHWMDIMDPRVNKGVALRALQRALGVAPEQTVVFGDYLNDLEMLEEATHSFAMANAHPVVAEVARHRAPSNREHGVLSTLERLLDEAAEPAG